MENYQIRSKVHPKQRVAVLLKEDCQNTTHPRGCGL